MPESPRRPSATRSRPLAAAALLASVLAAWAPARAEVHGRVRAGVRAGAGYASDLFLGARLGPSAEAQVAPSARGDLSLTPRLKLWGEYDVALGYFQSTRGGSLAHLAQLGSRLRLARAWTAELSGAFDQRRLTAPQALQEQSGLQATRATGGGAAAAVRWMDDGERLAEATYEIGQRRYVLDEGGTIDDLVQSVALRFGSWVGPLWTSLTLDGAQERSEAAKFSFEGLGAQWAVAAAPIERLQVRGAVELRRNLFSFVPRQDTLLRASLGPRLRVASTVWVESSYGYAHNHSSQEDARAERHFGYLGVRVEGDVWQR